MYDFAALTLLHPPLLAHLSLTKFGKQYIQNTNQGAREWNIAIAKKEFGIELTIPDEAIVPTMGGREMYVDWIGGMNTEKAKDKRVKPEQPSRKRKREETIQHRLLVSTEEARILDIGCGATAIYALIAAKKWGNQAKFWITDIRKESIQYASQNVKQNHLEDKITVILKHSDDNFFKDAGFPAEGFDCTMCNPPYFDKNEAIIAKDMTAPTDCKGLENELFTDGGEVHFVTKMIDESMAAPFASRWFTSMIGVRSHYKQLIQLLTTKNIYHETTEFVTTGTVRWAIAWSFTRIRIALPVHSQTDSLAELLPRILSDSGMRCVSEHSYESSSTRTWSRAYRRKLAASTFPATAVGVPLFTFDVTISDNVAWLDLRDSGTPDMDAWHSFVLFLRARVRQRVRVEKG